MAHSDAPGLLSRRSTLAGSTSLALHAGLVALAVVYAGARVVDAPRRIALTTIEVVSPAPRTPTPEPEPTPVVPAAAPSPVVPAARPSRAVPAPRRAAAAARALDLQVSYDDPSNFAGRPTDAPDDDHGAAGGIDGGRGIGADSRRQLQDSLASVVIPVPPAVSLARPARALHDYHRLRLHSVRRFAGMTIKLVLTIDARGRVSDVGLVEGVDWQLDRRVIELARRFEFDPARDADGAPVSGTSKWNIQIIDDDDGKTRNAFERGYF
jgi:outer membrane biosynthesis protein TonB